MNKQNDHANVKIHPPILLLIHLFAAFALNWLLILSSALPKFVEWVGYGLILTGLLFAFWAMNQFKKADTTLDPHGLVSAVVVDGPYRFSRNPIYIGLLSILIGIPLIYGNVWGVVVSPFFILLMNHFVIQHEEAYLEEKFKDVYTSYKSRVRRWL
ncbi:MAG TPA: isoprenylcysteine carboxylmethyltransferase family protein [Anaerolineales bacterium]|nr:isoprenylcysteine carboxylmethyltransferase family protein [Anaerolineales bacterium]